jgi:prefoldin subunit 5
MTDQTAEELGIEQRRLELEAQRRRQHEAERQRMVAAKQSEIDSIEVELERLNEELCKKEYEHNEILILLNSGLAFRDRFELATRSLNYQIKPLEAMISSTRSAIGMMAQYNNALGTPNQRSKLQIEEGLNRIVDQRSLVNRQIEDLKQRIHQLERQLESLRADLSWIRWSF